jgi:transcriptional regulator with XRE-family HTH domain
MTTERQRQALERMTPEQRARVDAIREANRTPERRAEIEAVRAHYKDRPTRDELIRRGEIDPDRGMPMGALASLHAVLADLKRLRESRGLAAAEVGRRAGISPAAMSRLESGRNANPTFETLSRYARAIGAELTLGIREPDAGPEGLEAGRADPAERVETIRAALTNALRELESLSASV